MSTITVSLPPELRDLVESEVRSGMYGNISEVVREAFRVWEAGDQTEDPELEALIADGLESATIPWTASAQKAIRQPPRRA